MRATVGDLEVIGVSDGVFRMPALYFGLDDWPAHRQLAGDDGTVHLPIGCFVVRSGDRTILIDAGLGPRDLDWIVGGQLPAGLAAAGFAPADFDTVVLSHVHLDHVGWLVRDGEPFFPNAAVRFGAADAELITGDGSYLKPAARDVLGSRVELIDGDTTIAPGVTTLAAPGHTPGHMAIVLSSGDERALLLGDAVTCPVQLEEPDWAAMSDMDKELAARTRQRLYDELEGRDDLMVGAHFPDLQMGRVLTGNGKRYFG
jgi:glyoxylase-like metal-dependent hydrolase (beta-lactamase superfamily II)